MHAHTCTCHTDGQRPPVHHRGAHHAEEDGRRLEALLTHLLTYSLTYLLAYSLTYLLTYLLTCLLIMQERMEGDLKACLHPAASSTCAALLTSRAVPTSALSPLGMCLRALGTHALGTHALHTHAHTHAHAPGGTLEAPGRSRWWQSPLTD